MAVVSAGQSGIAVRRNAEARLLHRNDAYVLDAHTVNQLRHIATDCLLTAACPEAYMKAFDRTREALGLQASGIEHALDDRILDAKVHRAVPLHRLTVKRLSERVYLSESRLSHLFKEEVGISLSSYILLQKWRRPFTIFLAAIR